MKRFWFLRAFKFALLALIALALFGAVVMGLWNALVPALFAGPVIGFWQALGLLVLSKILFGGLRGPGGHRHGRARMAERWAAMNEEEREKFRAGMRGRCGGRAAPPAA